MNNVSIRATMGLNPGNLQIISFNAWISSDLAVCRNAEQPLKIWSHTYD